MPARNRRHRLPGVEALIDNLTFRLNAEPAATSRVDDFK